MSGNAHTSVRSRRVAGQLRTLREQTGLSCSDVAAKMGMSASKVSRIETGTSGLQPDDVAALLGLYQVPAPRRAELLELVRRGEERGWWERQPGLPRLWRSLIDFESRATRIQNFQPLMIPGLLQTAEYSRAMIAGTDPTLSDAELDNLVASRMARQTLLTKRDAPQFLGAVDERALRQPVGEPGVMARQRRWLFELAQRPHIRLQVVPISVGAYVGLRGPFLLMEFRDDPALVHLENHDTGMFLEEETDLAAYRLALRNIMSVALAPDATLELLSAITDERCG